MAVELWIIPVVQQRSSLRPVWPWCLALSAAVCWRSERSPEWPWVRSWSLASWIKISQNHLPSGKHTKSFWKWPFIVSFPMKNGDFPIVMLNYQRVAPKWFIKTPSKNPGNLRGWDNSLGLSKYLARQQGLWSEEFHRIAAFFFPGFGGVAVEAAKTQLNCFWVIALRLQRSNELVGWECSTSTLFISFHSTCCYLNDLSLSII